jgi:CRISPR-associated protein Csd1
MILQSLHQLYGRLAENPSNGLPRPGYSLQNISFRIVLNPDGTLAGDIQDARSHETVSDKKGKEKTTSRPTPTLMPGQSKPPGQGINPCFLWDNTVYMLGYKPDDDKPDRTREAFEAFKQKHLELESIFQNNEFSAVCRFLEKWNPETALDQPIFKEIKTGFGVFQLAGTTRYVHQHPAIQAWWDQQIAATEEGESGICLITGRTAPLATLHDPAIKGVVGAQSSGAKLVSFNLNAFTSYAKEQGQNSPVSESAAFAYCNALNFLLADPKRRFRVGDTTCVYWTDQPNPTPSEELIPFLISAYKEQEDQGIKSRLQNVLEKLSKGQLSGDDLGGARATFYLLGLSPNASRLSIRFWHTETLGDLATNLQRHFDQLKMIPEWESDPKIPSAFQLLLQTSREADDIPPLLSGAVMRAILLGTRYPEALYTSVLRRIKADRNVNYLKASILKASLNRNHQLEIQPMLDPNQTDPGYRLGRLFASLEKTQEDAGNSGLRERFYSAASATPGTVFPRVLRTYQHHLAKLSGGLKTNREKLVQEILSPISVFPSFLNLEAQGMFALGYYHQRKDFYTKKESEPNESNQ